MASGKEHAQVAKRTAVGLTWVSVGAALAAGPVALSIAVGGWLGWLITPDMDLPGITFEERRILNFFRPLGWAWLAYWHPYARIVGHRSPWSHLPVVATAVRMIYALWPVMVFADLPMLFWALVLLGWSIQDFEHLRLDGFRLFL